MKAKYFLSLLQLCIGSGFTVSAAPDTVSIYFPISKSTLTEAARRQLDAAIYKGTISEQQHVQIIGYADEVGGNTYNLALSRQRATCIKTYLIQSGFNAGRITLVTGKGEAGAHAASGPEGNPADRRVDIVKDKAPPLPELPKAEPRQITAAALHTLAPGETLPLDNIYFRPGMPVILWESCDALDALFNALRSAPDVRIRIEGHVCCPELVRTAADAESTMNLSVARARMIYNFLVERGIPANRIEYAGFGYKRPLVTPERTETDRVKNRRVEIRVIK